jgi:hypothetical protein
VARMRQSVHIKVASRRPPSPPSEERIRPSSSFAVRRISAAWRTASRTSSVAQAEPKSHHTSARSGRGRTARSSCGWDEIRVSRKSRCRARRLDRNRCKPAVPAAPIWSARIAGSSPKWGRVVPVGGLAARSPPNLPSDILRGGVIEVTGVEFAVIDRVLPQPLRAATASVRASRQRHSYLHGRPPLRQPKWRLKQR